MLHNPLEHVIAAWIDKALAAREASRSARAASFVPHAEQRIDTGSAGQAPRRGGARGQAIAGVERG